MRLNRKVLQGETFKENDNKNDRGKYQKKGFKRKKIVIDVALRFLKIVDIRETRKWKGVQRVGSTRK